MLIQTQTGNTVCERYYDNAMNQHDDKVQICNHLVFELKQIQLDLGSQDELDEVRAMETASENSYRMSAVDVQEHINYMTNHIHALHTLLSQ